MSILKKLLVFVLFVITALSIYNLIPEKKLSPDCRIDSILVIKSSRQLFAYSKGQIQKVYTISLGKRPSGDKECEGDKKTPEGIYYINSKNASSAFYKNLGVSYPNEEDIKYASKIGKPTGGDIKIHGIRNGFGMIDKLHRLFDWTAGCIAVTNDEIDELYNSVDIGTKIEIRP